MEILLNSGYGGFSLSDEAIQWFKEKYPEVEYPTSLPRHDRRLLECYHAPEMEDKMDGDYGEIVLVTVPDGTDYQIMDDDGNESLIYKFNVLLVNGTDRLHFSENALAWFKENGVDDPTTLSRHNHDLLACYAWLGDDMVTEGDLSFHRTEDFVSGYALIRVGNNEVFVVERYPATVGGFGIVLHGVNSSITYCGVEEK